MDTNSYSTSLPDSNASLKPLLDDFDLCYLLRFSGFTDEPAYSLVISSFSTTFYLYNEQVFLHLSNNYLRSFNSSSTDSN